MQKLSLILLLFISQFAIAGSNLVPEALIDQGNDKYFTKYAFVVDKKSKTLTVWQSTETGTQKLAEFPSDIGRKLGNKSKRADFRTPEGIYFLTRKLEGSGLDFNQYGKRAFTTDYPNLFDQREGKTGSGIWLHAIPETVSLERGSRGCVVVRNQSIDELTKYVVLKKTPLIIHDEIKMTTEAELQKERDLIHALLYKWESLWSEKKLDEYMTHYSSEFYTNKMHKDGWQKFKQGLFEKYENIKVELSNPVAYSYKHYLIVRALQHFKSNLHEDFGEKLLFIKKINGEYLIIAEDWIPVDDKLVQQEISSNPLKAVGTPQATAKTN